MGQLDAHLQAAPARVAQQAAQVVGQLLDGGECPAQALPGATGQGARRVACAHHLAQQRQGFGGHVELRIQIAAHAFQRNEGLDEQGQIGRQTQVVFTQDGGDVGQHLAQLQLCQGHAVVLVDKGFHLRFQLPEVDALGIARPVQQHLGHCLWLALHQAQQHLQQLVASPL